MDRDWEIITNIEAAHRQLRMAMLMYFVETDIIPTHALACAAREIYEKHCKLVGIRRYVDFALRSNPDLDEKTLWKHFNAVRNFIKHPDASGDPLAEAELCGAVNKAVLFNASIDCISLCGESGPAYATAFLSWFYATTFTGIDWGDPHVLQEFGEFLDEMEQQYPGLRSASEQDQKEFGGRLIAHAAEYFQNRKDWAQWMKGKKFNFRLPIEAPEVSASPAASP